MRKVHFSFFLTLTPSMWGRKRQPRENAILQMSVKINFHLASQFHSWTPVNTPLPLADRRTEGGGQKILAVCLSLSSPYDLLPIFLPARQWIHLQCSPLKGPSDKWYCMFALVAMYLKLTSSIKFARIIAVCKNVAIHRRNLSICLRLSSEQSWMRVSICDIRNMATLAETPLIRGSLKRGALYIKTIWSSCSTTFEGIPCLWNIRKEY